MSAVEVDGEGGEAIGVCAEWMACACMFTLAHATPPTRVNGQANFDNVERFKKELLNRWGPDFIFRRVAATVLAGDVGGLSRPCLHSFTHPSSRFTPTAPSASTTSGCQTRGRRSASGPVSAQHAPLCLK